MKNIGSVNLSSIVSPKAARPKGFIAINIMNAVKNNVQNVTQSS